MGKPAHEPSEATRELVELHSSMGTPQENISRLLGIDKKTLYKYYREELDTGADKANAAVVKSLYSKATDGDTTAAIWWTKTRLGWSEKIKVDADVKVGVSKDSAEF